MYPQPPPTHRPTNYYWILVVCVLAMLGLLFMTLVTISGRVTGLVEHGAINAVLPSAAPARLQITPVPQPTVVASEEAAPAVEPTATPPGGIIDVDPKTLTASPGTYRSRPVRVKGTVFYIGKLEGGKTWIQIVDDNNVYVDGQTTEPVPANVTKGAKVQITGIGAGLTSVTASNGKDYDQAYVDPVDSIELVSR
ncbi:MAG TPA: hypothetical protein VK009_30370 [Chloroflexota bacterium]|nr:hypothetical protein [Chloroflexota bacterium]